MTPISIARIAVLFLVLTAAFGAALVSRIYETQPSVETRAATTAAAVAPTADVGDEGSAALAKALPPTVSPGSPDIGDVIMPAFALRSLGERVTQLSLARLRPVLLWNCCATARSLIERLQINSDGSSWSKPIQWSTGMGTGSMAEMQRRDNIGE
jgi:hypothetical protein